MSFVEQLTQNAQQIPFYPVRGRLTAVYGSVPGVQENNLLRVLSAAVKVRCLSRSAVVSVDRRAMNALGFNPWLQVHTSLSWNYARLLVFYTPTYLKHTKLPYRVFRKWYTFQRVFLEMFYFFRDLMKRVMKIFSEWWMTQFSTQLKKIRKQNVVFSFWNPLKYTKKKFSPIFYFSKFFSDVDIEPN